MIIPNPFPFGSYDWEPSRPTLQEKETLVSLARAVKELREEIDGLRADMQRSSLNRTYQR